LSNLAIAGVFGLLIRFGLEFLSPEFLKIAALTVFINILLAIFNLIPIPPLDGSKILFSFIPFYSPIRANLERYGLFFVLIFIFFLWRLFIPIVYFVFHLLTGSAAAVALS